MLGEVTLVSPALPRTEALLFCQVTPESFLWFQWGGPSLPLHNKTDTQPPHGAAQRGGGRCASASQAALFPPKLLCRRKEPGRKFSLEIGFLKKHKLKESGGKFCHASVACRERTEVAQHSESLAQEESEEVPDDADEQGTQPHQTPLRFGEHRGCANREEKPGRAQSQQQRQPVRTNRGTDVASSKGGEEAAQDAAPALLQVPVSAQAGDALLSTAMSHSLILPFLVVCLVVSSSQAVNMEFVFKKKLLIP